MKFNGVRALSVFDLANKGKKIFAENVTFDKLPNEICETKENSNILHCKQVPDSNSGRLITLPTLMLLPILHLQKSQF